MADGSWFCAELIAVNAVNDLQVMKIPFLLAASFPRFALSIFFHFSSRPGLLLGSASVSTLSNADALFTHQHRQLAPHAMLTRRRCCPTARCLSQEERNFSAHIFASAELPNDPASGDLESHRQPRQGIGGHTATLLPNGKVRLVAGGSSNGNKAFSPARTSRSGQRNLDHHGQPQHGTLWSHGDAPPNGKVPVAGGLDSSFNVSASAEPE